MSDFDIIDVAKDSTKDLSKIFGKNYKIIIAGGVIIAGVLGFWVMRKNSNSELVQQDNAYDGYETVNIPDYSTLGSTTGGTVSAYDSSFSDYSTVLQDLISMQTDTQKLIYEQKSEIENLKNMASIQTVEKTNAYAEEYSVPVQKSTEYVYVNQGVSGRKVLESADSVEARQKERYEKAKAAGNEKYMQIVKTETEQVLGKKLSWDEGTNEKVKKYVEGGHTYENKNGKIYKDGRLISEKDYKYIPAQVGGSRDDSKASSKTASSKIYVEGGHTYENKNGKIYKDGRLISEKDYKYIPSQIGGSRK